MQTDTFAPVTAYFAFDAVAEQRHEYWHGQIVAMAGETYNHNAVKDDLIAALRQRTTCDVLSSGMRVYAPGYGKANYAYPDGLAICTEKQFDATTQPPTLINPTLLIEVVSDSTRSRDFADKLEAYFRLDSLQEYWIVESDRAYVAQYVRSEGRISVRMIPDLDQELHSEVLAISIPLREIYRRVPT